MQTIRDAQALVGMLERGELNQEMTDKIEAVVEKLLEHSNEQPKATFKGQVSLVLNFAIKNGVIELTADIPPPKLPKIPRKTSIYWAVEGGKLSTEHPQQHDMFPGPRVIDRSQQQ